MHVEYIYTITYSGWGCVKLKNGEEYGFIRNNKIKPSETIEQNAINHARTAIKTANTFGKTEPTIFGIKV